jgi:triphosphoribosyl-dephospho-CoA synthetase
MPDHLEGKTIVTNTTTKADRELFKQAGVKYLITTTPVFEERSYGTNMLEAGLLAATGRQEPVDYAHAEGYLKQVETWLDELNIKPQFKELS